MAIGTGGYVVLSYLLIPLVAVSCRSHPWHGHSHGHGEEVRCWVGRKTLGVTASEVRDDSSMLVTGAPIGFGDPSPALSNAHVVMQCNAIVY